METKFLSIGLLFQEHAAGKCARDLETVKYSVQEKKKNLPSLFLVF